MLLQSTLAGATLLGWRTFMFQSTRPRGVRAILRTMLKPEWFQSTRGATAATIAREFHYKFQSTRPCGGGDV
jgi:hypothetical protein